ncbi:hypothetical protein SAMN04488590_3232 [Microbacterium sp. 77mftsu3.1]|nr:hypothetical protein SAMN04488590_3232 [Microbacterium sp. 77mftsu3.1]
MNTTTAIAPSSSVSADAAYMPGMNTSAIAAIARDALRSSTSTPNYDRQHERVNAVAVEIARTALELSGGRSTYSYEGNGIRLSYTGDTTNTEGEFAYGPTIREYLVDGEYKTTAPLPSQSGTGLLNLALDHVKDCKDPIVEAKRYITWLLLDPSLELVDYTMRVSTAWHGLMQEPHKMRMALSVRLAEVIEQKILENPGGGLDLKDLLEGTNVVGYMVKTLDGSIFNLMKRIKINEDKHRTTFDTPNDEGDEGYRRPEVKLTPDQLPQSAENAAIENEADTRAFAIMELIGAEEDAVAAAKAENKAAEERGEQKTAGVRSRRSAEKSAIVARTFLAQTQLPAPVIPDVDTRKQLIKQLDEDDTLAVASFMEWGNILGAELGEPNDAISDAWLNIWATYTLDNIETMIEALNGRWDRLTKVVEGALALPEPMSAATKKRIRDIMVRTCDGDDLAALLTAAIKAYDEHLQTGETEAWTLAAETFLDAPGAPALAEPAQLALAFDAAAAALVY